MTDRNNGMQRGGLASQAYAAVRNAGQPGIKLGVLRTTLLPAMPDLLCKRLGNMMHQLKLAGFVQHDGELRIYRVTDACAVPAFRLGRKVHRRLIDLVLDCPAGVCEQVLSVDAGIPVEDLQAYLAADVRAGKLQRITLPQSHGGGAGYRPTAGGTA